MKTFPQTIWLIRHGESIGNIARRKAEENNAKVIASPHREPDVELSPTGIEQAEKLGRWFSSEGLKPSIIYTSPYKRAQETARIMLETSGIDQGKYVFKYDERLRERELGVFDCLTKFGAVEKYPELCEQRERWGKFYFRPPGGESWADVIIRLRSFIETDLSRLERENVVILTHEVVVRCFRYILEAMSEKQILEIDGASDVKNGGITSYEKDNDGSTYSLKLDNYTLDF